MKSATITINEDGAVRMDITDGSSYVHTYGDYVMLNQILIGLARDWERWVELDN